MSMNLRKWFIAGIIVILLIGATVVAFISGWIQNLLNISDGHKTQSGYGYLVKPLMVIASDELTGFSAQNVIKNSGFIGTGGKLQVHLADPHTMWKTSKVQNIEVSIQFEFENAIPLSEVWIWNYNESSYNGMTQTNRGLKNIKIYVSTDNQTWTEWKGEGYPFELAKSEGTQRQQATNLNNANHTPIRFNGVPVKSVKFVAEAVPGKGNWGGANGHENVFGLSKVLFYAYTENIQVGSMIYPHDVTSTIASKDSPYMMINNFGMSGQHAQSEVHDADVTGRTMWLSQLANANDKIELVFDLGGTYPLDNMQIWNYNRFDTSDSSRNYTGWGLKHIQILYSIDNKVWTELKSEGYPYRLTRASGDNKLLATNLDDGKNSPIEFQNVLTRYVKLVANNIVDDGNWGGVENDKARFGLSEVRFFCGEGVITEPAPDWDMLFSRYFEWTGADGIFSIPLSEYDQPSRDGKGNSSSKKDSNPLDVKTWFLFSDTFIGTVNADTKNRSGAAMPNNTGALLQGVKPDPKQITFKYGTNGEGIDTKAMFVPDLKVVKPGYVPKEIPDRYWYWLQDGVVIHNHLYILPLLMKDGPGAAGFQFRTDGVSLIDVPLDANQEPILNQQKQHYAPLLYQDTTRKIINTFGAGILANTKHAGAPSPDGYIYIYGYQDPPGIRSLLVARVLEDEFTSFDKWSFWNGTIWSPNIADAMPLADHVSPELSITPMLQPDGSTRYMLVYQKNTLTNFTAFRLADHPWGPFDEEQVIYANTESTLGQAVFTYNAKAHPHISQPGELLVTYNVNSMSWKTNMDNADVYRPRWFRIKQVTKP